MWHDALSLLFQKQIVAVVKLIWLNYILLGTSNQSFAFIYWWVLCNSFTVSTWAIKSCKLLKRLWLAWQELWSFSLLLGSALHLTTVICFLSNCGSWYYLVLIVSDYWLQHSPLIAAPREYSGYLWYYVSVLCFPILLYIFARRQLLIIFCFSCLNM